MSLKRCLRQAENWTIASPLSTALIEAAQGGRGASCAALVTEGHARVDRESRTGLTALIAAALANNKVRRCRLTL